MEKKFYEVVNHYVGLGFHKGCVVWEPVNPDERAKIGILLMHSDSDYFDFIPGPELAKRGFITVSANVSDMKIPIDRKIEEVGFYFNYLKNLPGVEKVVILGHSGGATMMSCYQAVAENGPEIFRDDHRIVKMSDIKPLTPADGVLLLDSNYGNGVMNILSVDPAITDETNAKNLDPEYDAFDPANGFDPAGSHYPEEFVLKYNKKQEERFNKIIDRAVERVKALDAGEGDYQDDEPFIVPGGTQYAPVNRLFPQDLKYLSHTKEAYPLIHADGSVTTEVVYSKRPPKWGHNLTTNLKMGTEITTARTYATSSAVRSNGFHITETEVAGIDYDSCYCCTPGNVKYISSPILIMGMTGGYEFLAAEVIYKNTPDTTDKTICFVDGATHNFTPEKETGDWGDTVALTFDYVTEWILNKIM